MPALAGFAAVLKKGGWKYLSQNGNVVLGADSFQRISTVDLSTPGKLDPFLMRPGLVRATHLPADDKHALPGFRDVPMVSRARDTLGMPRRTYGGPG